MTTVQQDKAFLASIINATLLEDAINWIQGNMEPQDVFNPGQLEAWADDNDYVRKE